jgi:hypothetical protein
MRIAQSPRHQQKLFVFTESMVLTTSLVLFAISVAHSSKELTAGTLGSVGVAQAYGYVVLLILGQLFILNEVRLMSVRAPLLLLFRSLLIFGYGALNGSPLTALAGGILLVESITYRRLLARSRPSTAT